jgi:hypothetical protein
VSIVAKAQDAAAQADNDLQVGAALSKRDKALCQAIGSGKVQDWVGKISALDSNGDGFGVLTIDVADGNAVATWNNAFSDYADHTLIKPGKLLDSLTEMREGQAVKFSGRFVSTNGCVNDSRLTKAGKLDDPEFVFRFSSVEKA